MKRKKSEKQIRKKSKNPYLFLFKSNKNYFIQYYQIEEGLQVCKGSVRTFYRRGQDNSKKKRMNSLVQDFFNNYYEKIKDKELFLEFNVSPKGYFFIQN